MLRFENIIATVLLERESRIFGRMSPDATVALCLDAFRTKALSSDVLRSAIERRWRGVRDDFEEKEAVVFVFDIV